MEARTEHLPRIQRLRNIITFQIISEVIHLGEEEKGCKDGERRSCCVGTCARAFAWAGMHRKRYKYASVLHIKTRLSPEQSQKNEGACFEGAWARRARECACTNTCVLYLCAYP